MCFFFLFFSFRFFSPFSPFSRDTNTTPTAPATPNAVPIAHPVTHPFHLLPNSTLSRYTCHSSRSISPFSPFFLCTPACLGSLPPQFLTTIIACTVCDSVLVSLSKQGLSHYTSMVRSMNGTMAVCVRSGDVELNANSAGFGIAAPSFNKLYSTRHLKDMNRALKDGVNLILLCDGNNQFKCAEMQNQLLTQFGVEIQSDSVAADAVANSDVLGVDGVQVPKAATIKISQVPESTNANVTVTPLLEITTGGAKQNIGVEISAAYSKKTSTIAVFGTTSVVSNAGIGKGNNAQFASKLTNRLVYQSKTATDAKITPSKWTEETLKTVADELVAQTAADYVADTSEPAADQWPAEFTDQSIAFATYGNSEPLNTNFGLFSNFQEMQMKTSNETDMSKLNMANIDFLFWINPTKSISEAEKQNLLKAKHLILLASQNSLGSADHPINAVASELGVRFMPGAVVSNNDDQNMIITTTAPIENGNKTTTAKFVFNDATYIAPTKQSNPNDFTFPEGFTVHVQSNGDQMVIDDITKSDRTVVFDNSTSVPLVVSNDRVFAVSGTNSISDFNYDPNTNDRIIFKLSKFMGKEVVYTSLSPDDNLDEFTLPSDVDEAEIKSGSDGEDLSKFPIPDQEHDPKIPDSFEDHLKELPKKWARKYEQLASKYELDQRSDKIFVEAFTKEAASNSVDIKDDKADLKPFFKTAWKAAAHHTKELVDNDEMPPISMEEMPEELKKFMESQDPENMAKMTDEEFAEQLKNLQSSTNELLNQKSQEQLENIENKKEE
eukprot:TRINITY_DN3475_c0_g1_i3.p1 TRINITY_DN3475_c0_g1~~TRINITY_DN3475_c0_g1_i3.p1  ORF type:complete len:780 (+),score=261.88 TRINITY_DN3475_c0_g1_i3:2236-4575(+)